jgi:hypothetical protein
MNVKTNKVSGKAVKAALRDQKQLRSAQAAQAGGWSTNKLRHL